MGLAHLGHQIAPLVRVSGGYAYRVFRLEADRGSFAVKEMDLSNNRRAFHVHDVFEFERAAFAAGIRMPEPMSADDDRLVHRWVDGEKLPKAPVTEAFAYELGATLARIHAIEFTWPHQRFDTRTPTRRDPIWCR